MKLGFSIIVCCYNSQEKIEKTFEALNNLRTQGFGYEVIIVDNNSTDNTYGTAVRLAKSCESIVVKVISEPISGKSHALVRGISKADFEYLLVCDDDNWLCENYLVVAFEILQRDATIGILGGRGVLASDAPVSSWFPEFENAWAVGSQAKQSGEVTNSNKAVWGQVWW